MAFNDEIMVASGEAYDPEHPSTEKATLEKTQSGGVYKIDDPTESTISDDDYFPFYDSSENQKKKTLWSNIVNKLKSIFNPPVADIVNVYGAKNLIPYPYHRQSGYTTNGATFTYDDEGIITVNKVAGNATAYFSLFSNILFPNAKKFLAPNKSYILSMELEDASNTSCYVSISGVDMAAIRNKATGKYEISFTTPETIDYYSLTVGLYYGATTTETNAKVKIMIRLASIQDDTYVPYAKTNKQLTNDLNKAYTTDDSASTTINDTDYIPISESDGTTKKKALWTTIVDKVKSALGIASSGDTYLKKDGTWGTPTDNTKVAKSGDTMSGALTFSTTQGIKYTGTKATYPMIKFIDNAGDTYGNGILIGGGGLTIIGGGESADTLASGKSGGEESLYLTNDGNVTVVTNLQNGTTDGKTFTFGNDGTFNSPSTIKQNNVPVVTSYDHPTNARYGTTGSTTKIKIKINSTANWMLCFTVVLYQGYKATKVMVSGYQYSNNYWHNPEAVILGDSNYAVQIPVYFGYDAVNQLWVGFDGGSYTGVAITDVCNGYTQISNYNNLFTISNVSSLATIQKTVYAYGSPAKTVLGQYTSNGGQQGPGYFGKNVVGFLMMNTTVNGNSNFKDWIIMDCYGGNDVGGAVAFGINRQNLGAYIMRSGPERTAWTGSAELLGTHNYSSYTVPKSGGAFTGDVHINRTNAVLRLYKTASLYCDLTTTTPSSNITVYLPKTGGTLALMSSSRRIKKNIHKITEEEAKKLLDIEVVKFDYKEFWDKDGKNQCGFIAEDVIKIIPETVHVFEDYDPNIPIDAIHNLPPEIDYRKFVPYLVKMVQIQQSEIDELKAEIKALKEG